MDYVVDKTNRSYFMGIAMIAVFVYHLFSFGLPYYSFLAYFERFFIRGYYGVDIFLFLSAYGLCHSYQNNKLSTFYLNRFKRLFPLYWLFLLTIICVFLSDLDTTSKIKNFVVQATGLQIFKHTQVNIEWYIPTLIVIYITFPLLFNLVQKYSTNLKAEIIFVLLTLLTCIPLFVIVSSALRIPVVLAGIIAFLHKNDKEDDHSLLIIFILMAAASFFVESQFWIFPLLLYATDKSKIYLPIYNTFSFIGKYTLEIYLAQVITTKYMLGKGYFQCNEFLTILEVTILTAIIAFVFHWIQEPFKRVA